MADSPTAGIQGNVQRAAAGGTQIRQSTRKSTYSWMLKALGIAMAGLLVFTGYWFFAEDQNQDPSTTLTPVGEWSRTIPLKIGCGVRFASGHGSWFRVQYRFYDSVWKNHQNGRTEDMSEFRYKLIRDTGSTPYRITCS